MHTAWEVVVDVKLLLLILVLPSQRICTMQIDLRIGRRFIQPCQMDIRWSLLIVSVDFVQDNPYNNMSLLNLIYQFQSAAATVASS